MRKLTIILSCFLLWTVWMGWMTATAEEVPEYEVPEYIVQFPEWMPMPMSAEETEIAPLVPRLGMYVCDEATAKELKQIPGVKVGVNMPLQLFETELPAAEPNDPWMDQQWNLEMVGMPESWYWNADGEGVRLAVIDSGVDTGHEDLKNQVSVSAKCTLLRNENGVQIAVTENPSVTVKHGTAVAGVAAAQTNNALGMAGVSQAEIIGLQGYLYMDDMIASIITAVDIYDCDVINLSLGTKFGDSEEQQNTKDMLQSVVDVALAQNVILVAASGNIDPAHGYGPYDIVYPAAYDGVVSVASVNKDGVHASHSIANDHVWVAAPGEAVLVTNLGGGYRTDSGTSYASPHVAAAAAILRGIDSGLTPEKFAQLLKETSSNTERNNQTGWGIMNLKAMVDRLYTEQGYTVLGRAVSDALGTKIAVKNHDTVPVYGKQLWNVYQEAQDVLVRCVMEDFSLSAQNTAVLHYPGLMDEGQRIRLLLWEDLQNMTPLKIYQ